MATRIERAEASLKKLKEGLDISKLNNVENRMDKAFTVLKSHIFQPHRAGAITDLASLFFDIRKAIVRVKAKTEDKPDAGGE